MLVRVFWAVLSASWLIGCTGGEAARVAAAGSSGLAGAPVVPMGGESAGGASGNGGAPGDAISCLELEPEPNDTPSAAVDRGQLSDCDSERTMTGTLAGNSDVDVWAWRADDSAGCLLNPTASSQDILRLCAFSDCGVGCASGFAATLGALDGCCQLTPGSLELEVDCDGLADDARVWVTVETDPTAPVAGGDCLDYLASLHF